jgi:hypothetical protein
MVTAAQVDDYRTVIDQMATAATADGVRLINAIDTPNPVLFRTRLVETLPDLLQPYYTASAEYSAVWYEELRRQALGGGYAARSYTDLPVDSTTKIAQQIVRPLFGQGSATVLSLMALQFQKTVASAGRDTLTRNVQSDTARVSYARVPKAGCCAFCALLASRGAAYGSSKAAGGVVGRGVERGVRIDSLGRGIVRGGGVKTSGTLAVGNKYHGGCRCVPTPVFQGQSVPYDLAKYQEMYEAMYKPETGFDLANIREKYGIK